MIIKKIEMKNVLKCRFVELELKENVIVIKNEIDCPARSALLQAMELMFSSKYATLDSITDLIDIKDGYIAITFMIQRESVGESGEVADEMEWSDDTPSTSQEAALHRQRCQEIQKERLKQRMHSYSEVKAVRHFSAHRNRIEFRIDNGYMLVCSAARFHKMFCINFPYTYDDNVLTDKDLFQILFSNKGCIEEDVYNDMDNPFGRFTELYVLHKCNDDLLSSMTMSVLTGNSTLSAVQRITAIDILKITAQLFEILTNEYVVWFVMIVDGKTVELEDLLPDNVDLRKLKTCIMPKSEDKRRFGYTWHEVEDGIQELLLVAFKLAITYASQSVPKLVYLRKLPAMEECQSMEWTAITFALRKRYVPGTAMHNYLQKIADACKAIGIIAFMEYTGGVPLDELRNVQVVELVKVSNGDGDGEQDSENDRWDIVHSVQSAPVDLLNILRNIRPEK